MIVKIMVTMIMIIIVIMPPAKHTRQARQKSPPIFSQNVSSQISLFLAPKNLDSLTHPSHMLSYRLTSCFQIIMFIPTMNVNMLIATPLTSFCATIGECQQKFLLGGAFYSPNERLLLPSLNVIFPDGPSMQWTLLILDTYMPSSGLTRRDVISKKENMIYLAEKYESLARHSP